MNQAQFASVLIKAMPYYAPYSEIMSNNIYMCHIVKHSKRINCSEWERKRAVSKITKFIYPKRTLKTHLRDNKFISENIDIIDTEYHKKALTFWAIQIALGKGYPSPTIERLSSYLTHDNPEGWKTAQKILNRYVK